MGRGFVSPGEIFSRLAHAELTKTQFTFGLAVLIACCAVLELGSETYKLLTYYPAPYGSYKKFVTTADTWLARDSGEVKIGEKNAGVKVVIGQLPAASGSKIKDFRLVVQGGIVIGDMPDTQGDRGALRVHEGKLQYHDGEKWTDASGGAAAGSGNRTVSIKGASFTVGAPPLGPAAKVLSCQTKAYQVVKNYGLPHQYNYRGRHTSCNLTFGDRPMYTYNNPATGCTASLSADRKTISVTYAYPAMSYKGFGLNSWDDCVPNTGGPFCNCQKMQSIYMSVLETRDETATVALEDYTYNP